MRVSGGSAPLSEGDGDREAVSDLLSRRGEQTNLVARAAAETARAAEERALVEAYRRGRVVERRELDGLWCTPATGRALDRHGWTHAEVTAALRNLVEDGDRATVGGLLQVLDGYRPTRGGRAAGGTR